MHTRFFLAVTAIALATLTGGCAGDTTGITTSSVDPKLGPVAPMAAKVDPVCVTLKSEIDTLRKEGVAEKVEKASTGKSSTVSIKRASLAKMAQLDRANSDFQAKCSTITPGAQQAQAAPSPIAAAVTNAAADAATNAATSAASKASTAAVASAASKASGALPKLP